MYAKRKYAHMFVLQNVDWMSRANGKNPMNEKTKIISQNWYLAFNGIWFKMTHNHGVLVFEKRHPYIRI